MYNLHEFRPSKFNRDSLFELVGAVESYPEFLPWCQQVRVRERSEDSLVADVRIAFKLYHQNFTTRVQFDPENYVIDITYHNGPFKYLNSRWEFVIDESASKSGENGCMIDFQIEFAFKTKILDKLLGIVFYEAVSRMIQAFEARAETLYGNNSQNRKSS